MKTMINNPRQEEELHDAALMLVALHEERRRLEDEKRAEEKIVDTEEHQKFLDERQEFTTRIKGEALMFANRVRKIKIMDEIDAQQEENKTFWKRLKTLIGWE